MGCPIWGPLGFLEPVDTPIAVILPELPVTLPRVMLEDNGVRAVLKNVQVRCQIWGELKFLKPVDTPIAVILAELPMALPRVMLEDNGVRAVLENVQVRCPIWGPLNFLKPVDTPIAVIFAELPMTPPRVMLEDDGVSRTIIGSVCNSESLWLEELRRHREFADRRSRDHTWTRTHVSTLQA